MYLKIDMISDNPIYMQIRNQIVMGIAKKELVEGEELPSVRVLAGDIGINMHTVNKAYSILKNQGFLVVSRRKNVVVNSKESFRITNEHIEYLEGKMENLIAEYIARGLSTEKINSYINKVIDKIGGEDHVID
ncbi:MAG: GntR family transcriptional regulator [Acidaminobacteraceae bacterium]